MRSDARALLGDRLFGNLDKYLLSFAQQISDGRLLLAVPATRTSRAATSIATSVA